MSSWHRVKKECFGTVMYIGSDDAATEFLSCINPQATMLGSRARRFASVEAARGLAERLCEGWKVEEVPDIDAVLGLKKLPR